MSWPTYEVGIDWENNGFGRAFPYTFPIIFGAPAGNDDVTADCMSFTYNRGRDAEMQRAVGGSCEMRLRNADGKYSPTNSGSALFGNLLPGRPVQIRATFAAGSVEAQFLFRGKIERIIPHPHHTEQYAYIQCLDGFDFLNRAEANTALFTATKTGQLVTEILDDVGWSSTLRAIDTGQDTVPLAQWHQVSALSGLQEIEASEIGFIYVNESGELAFEDRHHRLKSPHTASLASFDNTMSEIRYELSSRNIFNEVRATVTEVTLGATAVLWTLQDTPSIAAGASKTIWSAFTNFATNLITPAATTDYTANSAADGSGTNLTSSISIVYSALAQASKYVITNSAAVPAFLTLLQQRGDMYTAGDQSTAKADDATSQTNYSLRRRSLNGKYLNDIDQAQDYCNFILTRYKEPQAEPTMTLNNRSDAVLTQILTRQVSDRITVDNNLLGLDGDFYINRMQHSINPRQQLHTVTYTLAAVEEEEFWTLDISELGTSTKLAY